MFFFPFLRRISPRLAHRIASKYVSPPEVDGTPLTPVFTNGQDGYACCRIPCIVRTGDGSLLAVAEGRLNNCGDHGGIIRIIAKRSTDQGRTWGPLMVIGRNILPDGSEYVSSNPSPIVDRMDPDHPQGIVYVVFNNTEFSEFDVAAGKGVRRVCITASTDHGVTWSEPRDITAQVHRPNNPGYTRVYPDAAVRYNHPDDWRQLVPATGHGIQLEGGPDSPATHGRLFYIASVSVGGKDVYHMQNYAFWSDDHARTWHIGGIDPYVGHNETMAVELEDGSIRINTRNYKDGRPVGLRGTAVHTFDPQGGIHFGGHEDDTQLIEPTIQASIQRLTRASDAYSGGRSRIIFSAPDHPSLRVRMTVRLSYDEGCTWPVKRLIDPGPSAYGDLVVQSDSKIGLLYERGNDGGIYYTSFSLDWLTQGADSLSPEK